MNSEFIIFSKGESGTSNILFTRINNKSACVTVLTYMVESTISDTYFFKKKFDNIESTLLVSHKNLHLLSIDQRRKLKNENINLKITQYEDLNFVANDILWKYRWKNKC